jgi:VanZ family protein
MTLERSRLALLCLWGVLVVCVAVGELLPASSSIMVGVDRLPVSDKVLHGSAYLVLSFLPSLAIRDPRRGLATSLSMILLGGLLELCQSFSPGRSPDIWDEAANSLGVVGGILLALACRRYASGAWRKRQAA